MRLFFRIGFIAVIGVLFSGCATIQKPVALQPQFWSDSSKTIGIFVTELPKADTHSVGSQGLLDVAINQSAAKGIRGHLQSMPFEPFKEELTQVFSKALAEKGFRTKVVDIDLKALKEAKKPKGTKAQKGVQYNHIYLAPLKQDQSIDLLLLIEANAVGTIRSYYGFIPTSDPKGYFVGSGTLTNLDDNSLLWAAPVVQETNIQEPWDQEPEYPNVSQAVYEVVELGKQKIISDFFSSADQ